MTCRIAAAPLMVYMKKETSLNLSKSEIGTGNILAVAANIVARFCTGIICDILGPRRGVTFLLWVTTPAIFGIMFVQNAAGWIACRCVIGLSLATFVCSQVWCSQMYAKSVVGIANATSAGWGNLGGGVTNLLMPYIFLGFYGAVSGTSAEKEDLSWRLCYLVPLAMHISGGIFALTARDLPDGNIAQLEASGAKQKSKGSIILKTGLTNVNAWILTATYGMCFGVELTMNSVAALYFHEYHGLTPQIAGLLASFYGLMNLVARSAGGLLSDWSNRRAGMRGRLWSAWAVQTIEGALCCCMAAVTLGADAPFDRPDVPAYIKVRDLPATNPKPKPNPNHHPNLKVNPNPNPNPNQSRWMTCRPARSRARTPTMALSWSRPVACPRVRRTAGCRSAACRSVSAAARRRRSPTSSRMSGMSTTPCT